MNDAEQINVEVLQQWINGRGKHPVTWKTLTQVLHDIELGTLAREIEAVKCHTGIPTEPRDGPLQKGIQDIPAEESEQKSTGHTPASGPDDINFCKTSDELQIDVDQLAADLLDRYYEENRKKSAAKGFSEGSLQSLRNITVEVSKELDQRSSGDTPACGIQNDRYSEEIQQITDIASELPSRCSELLDAFELKDKSSSLHRVSNTPPFQKSQRNTTVVVTLGSEQRDMAASSIQHNLQQIVDVAADLLSRCFELEALNPEREEGHRSSESEGFEDTVDAAAHLLNRYFEAELFSCEASNHETQRSSSLHGASEDPTVQRALKDTTAMGTEGFKERGIRDVPASSIEDVWYNKALQQIADVAADLLQECFELLDSVTPNQTQRQNQRNSVSHGGVGENGDIPARDTKVAKCCEALQHIVDIGADILYRCFVLLDLQTSNQEEEENQRNSAPLKQTTDITHLPDEVLD